MRTPTMPAQQRRPRSLTVLVERWHGGHERLDLLVTPGTTVSQLPMDGSHATLVRPSGNLVGATDDLYEIAGDTPKLFALLDTVRAPKPMSNRRHRSLVQLVHLRSRAVLGRSMPALRWRTAHRHTAA